MSDELKPCPFCGPGQSEVDVCLDEMSNRYRVWCGRCGASSGQSPRDKTKAPAIAAWNRRAPNMEQAIREARLSAYEAAAVIVRTHCPACGGSGRQHSGRENPDECELCGRVIHALAEVGGEK